VLESRVSAPRRKFLVVGGGLGGALMAIYLGRAGHEVEVFERRPDPRQGKALEGRSINLAISTRGLDALARVGLADDVLRIAVPMEGRMIHPVHGDLHFQPYGTEKGQAINSVSRAGLNMALVEAAERQPHVRVRFGVKCRAVDLDEASVELVDVETGEELRARGDAIVGGDGAFSAVRREMQRLEGFDYSQEYLDHGYKELSIPPRDGGGHRMAPNALHIWPRGGFMMIALPNADGSYTCTCFWRMEGANSFAALRTEADVMRYFGEVFPDAVPLMPTLAKDYFRNPSSALVTIRCRPWHYRDRVVLLGDAAHAVVPFYGQGANAAFEDCVVLDECLRAQPNDLEAAFVAYERARKENTDALANLAVENFYEMRDKVNSRLFHWRKSLEKTLHHVFPTWFVPLYSMVTFSRTPYAEAVRRDRRQWGVVRSVAIAATIAVTMTALLILVAFTRRRG
jgi:kynurenine 3-monooxygenase